MSQHIMPLNTIGWGLGRTYIHEVSTGSHTVIDGQAVMASPIVTNKGQKIGVFGSEWIGLYEMRNGKMCCLSFVKMTAIKRIRQLTKIYKISATLHTLLTRINFSGDILALSPEITVSAAGIEDFNIHVQNTSSNKFLRLNANERGAALFTGDNELGSLTREEINALG